MKKSKFEVKVVALVALLIAVLGLSIAYAALSTTLNITGTATVKNAKWDVKFVSSTVEPVIVGSASFTKPKLEATTLSNYSVILKKPGDSVTYTFKISNAGSLDAKLNTFTKSSLKCNSSSPEEASATCSNLKYSVTYANGNTINPTSDVLKAGQSVEAKINITFNSSATIVPTSEVTVSGLDLVFVYGQA